MELTKKMCGRSFLALKDFSSDELQQFIDVGLRLKQQQKLGIPHHLLRGKALGMIFAKASTRTRVSFEAGIWQLGGTAIVLNTNELQLGRGETVADTARVLSRYLDGIMIRTFDHKDVVDLAENGTIPIINGLTDLYHPCQALADYMTIKERFPDMEGRTLTYIGDGNNVAHSLLEGAVKLGMHIRICSPAEYKPEQSIFSACQQDAEKIGLSVVWTSDPQEAVSGTDVIYTDVWASMGQEAEQKERQKVFLPYQVNEKLVDLAAPEVLVMHCLPAHRGEEITDRVMDGPHSIVFDQAENRLHAQKAIMTLLMM